MVREYSYFFDFWKHDANLHISLLYQKIRSELQIGNRPLTLYLQVDNCAKDNKNRYFFLCTGNFKTLDGFLLF
ncbi:MAG: hypothetical protein ACXV2C_02000 [Candidatus Bathyarchaeia archaeon]